MKEKLFYWNELKFDVSNQNVYPPKPASLLLADAAIKIINLILRFQLLKQLKTNNFILSL